MTIAKAALDYLRAGITTIPIKLDGSKAPAVKQWRSFIEEAPSEEEVTKLFSKDVGLGIVAGKTSGGLEIIDFDRRDAFAPWVELVNELSPGLFPRLPVVETPNGYHVYFRSAHCEANQKLAMGLDATEGKKSTCIIETRGQGGYVIAPPSPGEVHPTGALYVMWQLSVKIEDVPTLTEDERRLLIGAARSFNEVAESEEPSTPHSSSPQGAGRPGDDFATKATWDEILRPHGWSAIRKRGNATHWRRPGKDDKGISATTGFCGDKLYVFSSNAQPFQSSRAYGKFSAYAWLNNAGDFGGAARALKAAGFGEQKAPRRNPSFAELSARLDAMTPRHIQDAPPPDDTPAHTDDDVPGDVESARPTFERITAEQLEPLLDNDKAAAVRPGIFERVIAMRSDHAEWLLINELIRRHKATRVFGAAVKDHDLAAHREKVRREAEREEFLKTDRSELSDDEDLRAALACFGEVPVKGTPIIPMGYRIKRDVARGQERLVRLDTREKKGELVTVEIPVADRVPVVSAVLHDGTGNESIECVWPRERGHGWERCAAPRPKALDANKIMEAYGARGFPGSSETRRELVRWLTAYMRVNEHEIEHRTTSIHCGWHDEDGFLLGDTFFAEDGGKAIEFATAGDGEKQMVAGIGKQKGKREAWINMLKNVHGRPKLEIALYASLAAPLLRPLESASFALEWAGKTSSGKTTALRLAASVWGETSEASSATLLRNWAGTKIGIERYLTAMCDLPAMLDDTQTARTGFGGKRGLIEEVLYQLTSGGGMRGDKEGSRAYATWRTVLLSTGEQKMADMAQGGGAAARVLTIWGSPLDGMTVQEIHSLREAMGANFGHVGAEWVKFIVDNKARWPEWRAMHAQLQRKYLDQMAHLPDQGVAGRQANCMAVLGVAALLAVDALELPWGSDDFDPVEACVEAFALEIAQISRPRSGLNDLADHLASRMVQIAGTEEAEMNKEREPSNGWLAQLPRSMDTDEPCLAVFTTQLKTILKDLGYQPESLIRQWGDEGIILRGSDGLRSQVRINTTTRANAYRIRLTALADAGLDFRTAPTAPPPRTEKQAELML